MTDAVHGPKVMLDGQGHGLNGAGLHSEGVCCMAGP
jgi:hypothetical protein